MKQFISHFSYKFKIIFPVILSIVVSILIVTLFSINNSKQNVRNSIENYLSMEVQTLKKMFEREKALKIEKVITGLKAAHTIFYSYPFEIKPQTYTQKVENQINGEKLNVELKTWLLNGEKLNKKFSYVDKVQDILGGTVTVFQKIDQGYLRISTNVLKSDSSRATGTYIPNDSPVIKTIEKGETYIGRAYVVNDWYATAYEPLIKNNQLVGMLYVGNKEKDIKEIRTALKSLTIGKSGYTYVFDDNGILLIHPTDEGKNVSGQSFFSEMKKKKHGIIRYQFEGYEHLSAFDYFDEFNLYIVVTINEKEETKSEINNIILSSSIISCLIILILSLFIYLVTGKSIRRILSKLEQKDQKLVSAKEALKQSEDRFKTLFDNTLDEIFVTDSNENIIEVNIATCKTLGYTREELLSLKMVDIKTPKFAQYVDYNRKIIYKEGKYTFETEHVTKSGEVIQVEMKSRLVEYGNEKLILSISRNMSERKELERKILSVVIQTEERERERFSKDMHDGLGPLLSTIKLYVNELVNEEVEKDEKQKMVQYTNELIDEAVTSTRNISNNLMPRVIHEFGLEKAVESFCNKVNTTNKINIIFKVSNIDRSLDKNVELILFRVISELINNTLKYAQAKNIVIRLDKEGNKIRLHFADDGIGFDVENIMNKKNTGMGLKNIISRIRSINGNCNFISNKNQGFKIDIEIDV
jgi:PAS domain S-box-containing protein